MIGRTATNQNQSAPWFDPGWLIWRTLDAGLDAAPGAAETTLLAWIVRLPVGHDPAEAAGQLLHRYATDLNDPAATRLTELLEETQSYTPERLAQLRPRRRPAAGSRSP